jgi:GxxExxY protein
MSELTGKVIGLAMKVHRTLGPGFLESVYKKALQYELRRAGFKAELEKAIQIRYETIVVGDYFADVLVNDRLILEIKAIVALAAEHEVQLVNYLTATGKDVGLLLNSEPEVWSSKRSSECAENVMTNHSPSERIM